LGKHRQEKAAERKESNKVKMLERERRRTEGIGGALGAYGEDFGDFVGEVRACFICALCLIWIF
jgi:hypothetical protein